MPRRTSTGSRVATAVACAVLTGCGGMTGLVAETPTAAPPPPTAASGAARSAPATSSAAGAESRSLAIEQRHPNGSVLRLTGLTVESNAITVGIEVVNGSQRQFSLAPGGAVVGLTDDLGGEYEFIDPVANPDLEIQERGTLTGELVYFGVLNRGATTLRLQTNARTVGTGAVTIYDPATETTNELFPHFSVEIPLNQ